MFGFVDDSSMDEFKNVFEREFANVIFVYLYVDKSLFIKKIINNKFKKILITAPYCIGKNTNMDMLKTFLEFQVDRQGVIIDKESSSNYNLFKDSELLIYEKNKRFFNKHFATYPVLAIQFNQFKQKCFNNTIKELRYHMRYKFREYLYLVESDKLDLEEIYRFKKYTTNYLYDVLTKDDIVEGYKFLTECLYKHFNNKVFLLIDNYDAIINRSWKDERMSICHVYDLLKRIFTNTVNSEFVERAVITGVHYYDLFGPSSVKEYMFLHTHPFTSFIALTVAEYNYFLMKVKVDDKRKEQIENYYGHYTTLTGQKLYSKWSVLYELEFKEITGTLRTPFVRMYLNGSLFVPIIKYAIEKLCSKHSLTIEVTQNFEIEHMIELRRLYLDYLKPDIIQQKKPDLLLSFLLQEGFLIYSKAKGGNFYEVKVVSNLLIEVLRSELIKFYEFQYYGKHHHLIDRHRCFMGYYLSECADYFNRITPNSNNVNFKKFLAKLNEHLDDLFYETSNGFYNSMFDIMCKTDFLIDDEITFTDGEPDLVFHKDNFGIIIQVGYRKRSFIVLKQLLNKYVHVPVEESRLRNVNEVIYLAIGISEYKTANMSVLINSTNFSNVKRY